MAQQVKDPALSLQWLGSSVWCGFNPWLGNFHMPQAKLKQKTKHNLDVTELNSPPVFILGKEPHGQI